MACAAPVHTPEICPWAQAALQAVNLNKISWGPSLRIAVSNKTTAWSVACAPGAHICLGRQPPSRLACIRCSHLHARRQQSWVHGRYRSRQNACGCGPSSATMQAANDIEAGSANLNEALPGKRRQCYCHSVWQVPLAWCQAPGSAIKNRSCEQSPISQQLLSKSVGCTASVREQQLPTA